LQMPSPPGRGVVRTLIPSPQGGELVLPEKLPSRRVEGSDQEVKVAAGACGASNREGPDQVRVLTPLILALHGPELILPQERSCAVVEGPEEKVSGGQWKTPVLGALCDRAPPSPRRDHRGGPVGSLDQLEPPFPQELPCLEVVSSDWEV